MHFMQRTYRKIENNVQIYTLLSDTSVPGRSVSIVTTLRHGRSEFDSWQWQENFLFATCRSAVGPTQPPIQPLSRAFLRDQCTSNKLSYAFLRNYKNGIVYQNMRSVTCLNLTNIAQGFGQSCSINAFNSGLGGNYQLSECELVFMKHLDLSSEIVLSNVRTFLDMW